MTLTVDRTRVGLARESWLLLTGAGAALGCGLGLVLDPLVRWAVGQAWLPAPAVIALLGQLADAAPSWAQAVVGLALGVVAGLVLGHQGTVVEVADDEIVVLEGSRRRRLARSQVGTTVLGHGRLAVRDHADADLLDVKIDSDVDALRGALRSHAWPVRD